MPILHFSTLSCSIAVPQVSARFGEPFSWAFPVRFGGGEVTWRKAPPAATRYISRDQIIKLYSAILFANYQGAVFNVEMTIAWKLANVQGASAVRQALDRFLDRFRKFMTHRKLRAVYYAVHENEKKIGYHTHLALSVPDKHRKAFQRWWKNIDTEFSNGADVENLICVRIHKDDAVLSQWRWFQYCMKGLDPKLLASERKREGWENLDLNTLAGVWRRESGRVEMRRVLTSRSLGRDAQLRAQYTPPYWFNLVPYDERYTDAEYKRGRSDRSARELPILDLI